MERFLTTPLEEREKSDQIKSLNTRLSSNQAVIAKLEKELSEAVAERDTEVSTLSLLQQSIWLECFSFIWRFISPIDKQMTQSSEKSH